MREKASMKMNIKKEKNYENETQCDFIKLVHSHVHRIKLEFVCLFFGDDPMYK